MSSYIVCAFYTENYSEEVQSLKSSLEKFNIPNYLKLYKSRGYWEANTRIKPEFLLECLNKYPEVDIVYLDADAVVRQPMILFENFEEDIGVFVCPEKSGYSHRYLTGTLYLKNNILVRSFLQDWISAQKNVLLKVDQDSFEVAISKNKQLSIKSLPSSYTKIFDRGDEKAVIEHFQASRKRIKLQKVIKRTRNILFLIFFILLISAFIYFI